MLLTLWLFAAAIGTANPNEVQPLSPPDFIVHEFASNPNFDSTWKIYGITDGKNTFGSRITRTIAGPKIPHLAEVIRSAKAFLCEGLDEGDEINFGLTLNEKGNAWAAEIGGAESIAVHVKCHRGPVAIRTP